MNEQKHTSGPHEHGEQCGHTNRRTVLKAGVAAGVAVAAAAGLAGGTAEAAGRGIYADPKKAMLPPSNMKLDLKRTALVITDPQKDFLHPTGVAWGAVGKSVTRNGTVANIGKLFAAAKKAGLTVAVSPHYYYPTDNGWAFNGGLEKLMHHIKMFDRKNQYTSVNNSGADFMPQYKKYINDGKTIITSPHKVYGPEANDLVLQLRKNRIDHVILAGMSANLCVESHLRELLEQGFDVAVVRDATAGAIIPEGDGYLAAIINFRFIANALWTTDHAIKRMQGRA